MYVHLIAATVKVLHYSVAHNKMAKVIIVCSSQIHTMKREKEKKIKERNLHSVIPTSMTFITHGMKHP